MDAKDLVKWNCTLMEECFTAGEVTVRKSKRVAFLVEFPAGCVWPPRVLDVVWPAVHLCSVGASRTSHLLIIVSWLKRWRQTMRVSPHFLLCCQVVPRVHIRDWWPLSSSKSSNQSWWECLLFSCKLDLEGDLPICRARFCSLYFTLLFWGTTSVSFSAVRNSF